MTSEVTRQVCTEAKPLCCLTSITSRRKKVMRRSEKEGVASAPASRSKQTLDGRRDSDVACPFRSGYMKAGRIKQALYSVSA